MAAPQHRSEHFLDFIASLEKVLSKYDENTMEFQKDQVERLVKAEKDFRKALVRHPRGSEVYKAFINLIMVEKHNILMARPYFRERDKTFKASISHVLRDKNHRALPRFNVNFQFIDFVVKCRKWGRDPTSKKLLRLAKEVKTLRENLIKCNLPLAISQARIFYARNSASHHNYMDMVQIASGGLASGVDKFVGDYSKVFRAVLIGRILGDLIEANSETFVHFFPADKRRIYRVRKIVGSLRDGSGNMDYEEVAKILNKKESEEGEELTSAEDLHHLMGAASVVSANSLPTTEDEGDGPNNPIEKYADEASNRPDMLLEEAQSRRAVAKAIRTLPLLEQKLLRLRGIDMASAVL
jgi:DNA-directed RNA polymerase specialized sigma subunit